MSSRILAIALCLGALTSSHASTAVPPRAAVEAVGLQGGGWVILEKRQLSVMDDAGREMVRLAFKGEQLDARVLDGGALVAAMDHSTQSPAVLRLTRQGAEVDRLALPRTSFPVETICLYRDSQMLDHLFVVAESGQAEQWLLGKGEARLLRSLSLPAGTRHCKVDDDSGTLFASEEKLGVWAYGIGTEELPPREPVALRAPYGPLKTPIGAVQPLGSARLAVLDSDGARLQQFARAATGWKLAGREPIKPAAEQLSALITGSSASLWSGAAKTGWRPRIEGKPVNVANAYSRASMPVVVPVVQSAPVARLGDAADDPAIWVHPTDTTRSRVLATNKKQGLLVYDLDGKELQLIESGRINNVDLRQAVKLGGQRWDIAVATQRDDAGLVLYTIDGDGLVRESARIATPLKDIYGVCLYQPAAGGLEVFANDKDGTFSQIRIELTGDRFSGREVRQLKVATQPEGCVVDDRENRLWLGEEGRGIWVADARATSPSTLKLVMPVSKTLVADVEGMALYRSSADSAGYLVVSSQGNSSFVVLDALPPYRFRGAFRIGINADAWIDAVSETDGLDVTSTPMGSRFPQGMLVVQDGFKRLPDAPQNFKYVSWKDISAALKLEP